MTYRNTAIGLITAAAISAAPIAPAMARDHGHGGWDRGGGWGHERGWDRGHHGGGDGLLFGLLGAGAAVIGAAAYVATAPVRIIADAATPEPVYAEPGYPAPAGYAAAPAPVYAAPAYYPMPAYGYYARPHRVVYAAYPAPVYGAYPGY